LLAIIIIIVIIAAIFVINPFKEEEIKTEPIDNTTVSNPIAVFNTTMGSFKIELYQDKAPITAGNFLGLANSGYYNGITFHRVISEFMIQGGDPKGDGTGGHAFRYIEGYGNLDDPDSWTIPDEFHKDLSNIVGSISMANAGPNTGGSQFFINVVDNTYLDNKHAVFGMVIEGMDVVYKISNVNTGASDRPITDVIMNTITIED
jgi:cyclophilin family peptidyl-prolyl cis-trans isomerase